MAKRRRAGADDEYIVKATALLAEADRPPLDCVQLSPLLHETAWGQCVLGTGKISIHPDGFPYQAAKGGNLVPLAGVLAHENAHRVHGGSERICYAVELDVLRKLNADPDHVAAVERTAWARRHEGLNVDEALDDLAADVEALARKAGVGLGDIFK
jgi:hypothetical protein